MLIRLDGERLGLNRSNMVSGFFFRFTRGYVVRFSVMALCRGGAFFFVEFLRYFSSE